MILNWQKGDNERIYIRKLEAEVERLQKVYAITNESWKKQVEELTQLRKVEDAARSVAGFGPCHDANSYWSIKKLSNALDEYDKVKEGKER